MYRLKILWVGLFVASLSLLTVGCSGKPSNKDIELAVRKELEGGNSMWVLSPIKGPNVSINNVDVLKVGKFNKNTLDWPVLARVKGQHDSTDKFTENHRVSFSKEITFLLNKNKSGSWTSYTSYRSFKNF